MRAVVFHGIGDIRLDDVPEPELLHPHDAIVRLCASAICGTDLHFIRGTVPGMKPGTILGHEGVGVVEEVGKHVRNLKAGDRVVIPSTISCGMCEPCRDAHYAHCHRANPNGPAAGTAFYGGPESSGPFHGLQAELARVPYASNNLVKLPHAVTDDQAILLSDIFPTGYFGADLAEIRPGKTVAVFGCGPVGQFAIASALLMGCGRVIAIDRCPDRLKMAREQGAEVIDFNADDPVDVIQHLTDGNGADSVIDAVGVDAEPPSRGRGFSKSASHRGEFDQQLEKVASGQHPHGKLWHPGKAPSQALLWAVESVAKNGTIAIVGVYPEEMIWFPIGQAMNKNVAVRGGNCHHRRYIPKLINLVQTGEIDPEQVLTQREPLMTAIEAYKAFDQRQPGWIKVELEPDSLIPVSHPRFVVE